ncbi:uncharacterized protein LOC126847368 isoform X2 [Adelges cooleyi]|nr:uncharacterized protein LOC126847368 isoform X2 [Adelges cooleyi]
MTLYETLAHLDIQIKKNNSVACNISNKFEFKLFDIMKQWKIDQVRLNKIPEIDALNKMDNEVDALKFMYDQLVTENEMLNNEVFKIDNISGNKHIGTVVNFVKAVTEMKLVDDREKQCILLRRNLKREYHKLLKGKGVAFKDQKIGTIKLPLNLPIDSNGVDSELIDMDTCSSDLFSNSNHSSFVDTNSGRFDVNEEESSSIHENDKDESNSESSQREDVVPSPEKSPVSNVTDKRKLSPEYTSQNIPVDSIDQIDELSENNMLPADTCDLTEALSLDTNKTQNSKRKIIEDSTFQFKKPHNPIEHNYNFNKNKHSSYSFTEGPKITEQILQPNRDYEEKDFGSMFLNNQKQTIQTDLPDNTDATKRLQPNQNVDESNQFNFTLSNSPIPWTQFDNFCNSSNSMFQLDNSETQSQINLLTNDFWNEFEGDGPTGCYSGNSSLCGSEFSEFNSASHDINNFNMQSSFNFMANHRNSKLAGKYDSKYFKKN